MFDMYLLGPNPRVGAAERTIDSPCWPQHGIRVGLTALTGLRRPRREAARVVLQICRSCSTIGLSGAASAVWRLALRPCGPWNLVGPGLIPLRWKAKHYDALRSALCPSSSSSQRTSRNEVLQRELLVSQVHCKLQLRSSRRALRLL